MEKYHWHIYKEDRNGEINLKGSMKKTKKEIELFKSKKDWTWSYEVSKHNYWTIKPEHVLIYKEGKKCKYCDLHENWDIIKEFKEYNEDSEDSE